MSKSRPFAASTLNDRLGILHNRVEIAEQWVARRDQLGAISAIGFAADLDEQIALAERVAASALHHGLMAFQGTALQLAQRFRDAQAALRAPAPAAAPAPAVPATVPAPAPEARPEAAPAPEQAAPKRDAAGVFVLDICDQLLSRRGLVVDFGRQAREAGFGPKAVEQLRGRIQNALPEVEWADHDGDELLVPAGDNSDDQGDDKPEPPAASVERPASAVEAIGLVLGDALARLQQLLPPRVPCINTELQGLSVYLMRLPDGAVEALHVGDDGRTYARRLAQGIVSALMVRQG